MTPYFVLALALCAAASVHAQTSPVPASPAQPASVPSDDIPMADYLGLLQQIAPAARDGAQAYMHAYQQRCGRSLTTPVLRRAMSEGSGDPVLMGMIRASQLRDDKSLSELSQRVACGERR